MKGLIIINPYKIPYNSVIQAQRLQTEFACLGVETEIITDGYTLCHVDGLGVSLLSKNADFIVYLDKDKYLSAMLEKSGVKLFNSHNSIRVCDDKGDTYVALSNCGVSLPKTIFAPLCYDANANCDKDFLGYITSQLDFPIVIKESYGSMGKGVYKADDMSALISIFNKLKTRPHLYQEYVDERIGYDVRVIVIGQKAVAIMQRENANDFRSNVGLGGKGTGLDIADKTLQNYVETAQKVACTLGLDYCGVDLLVGKDNLPVVCEVNSNAFFMEMEKATGINVASLYAKYIISNVK